MVLFKLGFSCHIVFALTLRDNKFMENFSGAENNAHKEDLRSKYYEAHWATTVSVKDVIPDMNVDGLQLKQKSGDNRGKDRIIEEDIERDLTWLPSGLATPYAGHLYLRAGMEERSHDDNAEEVRRGMREIAKELEKVFSGQIVIDVAAGSNTIGYRIANQAGARAYIAVEPVFTDSLLAALFCERHPEFCPGSISLSSEKEREMNRDSNPKASISIVAEDMLSFLKRLPDNSVSVWCSGVDNNVISDADYRASVAKEIVRVLHPDGAYAGQVGGMSIKISENEAVSRYMVGAKRNDNYHLNAVTIHRKKKS